MYRIAIGVVSLFLFASCATTPQGPSAAARTDLAPTGKLRVGINFQNRGVIF